MKVEIKSPNQVSKEFLDFVQLVSDKENLNDWKLIIWNIKGEAECVTDMKLIYLTAEFDVERTKTWFLHEVAHATFDMSGGSCSDSMWHRKGYKEELNRLLKYYMPDISQKAWLWVDGIGTTQNNLWKVRSRAKAV